MYIKDLYKKYESGRQKKLEEKHTSYYSDKLAYYQEKNGSLKLQTGTLVNYIFQKTPSIFFQEIFYFYKDGVYVQKNIYKVLNYVRECLIVEYATTSDIKDVVEQWKMIASKDEDEIMKDLYIINTWNGLYYVEKEALFCHNPKFISLVQIKANYNIESKCNMFLKFLSDCLDEEEIKIVQEILGYLLVPTNKAQKAFIFVGVERAGKSTLLYIIQKILGDENVSNLSWHELNDRFKKAELLGKLANIYSDLSSKGIDDNSLFKSITGDDYITAEKKNMSPFKFKPYARLLFSCNKIPRNLDENSIAFYRRLIIIPFQRSIPENLINPNLKKELLLERDGIFMWALEGLKRLIKNNYEFSKTEKTNNELERYRIESNNVVSFIKEYCDIDNSKTIESLRIYQKYKEYCEIFSFQPLSQIAFNKELEKEVPSIIITKDSVTRRKIYQGIDIKA